MDKDISSASKYLNNLLAARGLLKGGHKIAFDNPTEDEITPTRIINLVHDLVRRRDRDGEQKETLAMGMKALKESESKANALADRYKSRSEELERRCATLQGQERVLNANVRSAEITAKALKDETGRLKVMVQQVRTQCANDIRKRDHQISKMKERLLEKSRGGRGNKQPISFPGVTLSGSASTTHLGTSIGVDAALVNPDHALTDDTTAILTTLSQNLADENDTLVSMIKSTVTTLKAISGMDTDVDQEAELEEGDRNVIANDVSYTALSNEVDEVLEHLKDMLNQPNYVPLEDLDVRDKEIERLRLQLQGTLEAWKNAIALVDLVNKKPDKTSSKQIKSLEGVVARERQVVLEELDVNTHKIPANVSLESPTEDSENTENWPTESYQSKLPKKLSQLEYGENEDLKDVKEAVYDLSEIAEEAIEEEIEERTECPNIIGYAYHRGDMRIEGALEVEDVLEGMFEGGEVEAEFHKRTGEEELQNPAPQPTYVDQKEESVDLVPPTFEEDESSMEMMSPIKHSIYTKVSIKNNIFLSWMWLNITSSN
ncbi:hypothetical protein H072_2844 [Dactylellina haptotyla CBS 200.50]|uniref:NIMA interactive protein n=1 Tax=Dactylellina haptotyla (strain CBS 200.50) TaxID=1284197 RepID=S8BUL7_DACHA|nr:hypothetical protein H072_2844 [Dactylellina haptotyla CBS 200.50]